MSRQVYLLGEGLVLVGLAFVATDAAMGPRPGMTETNAKRIRKGMTVSEVEAILGPRDKVPGPLVRPDPVVVAYIEASGSFPVGSIHVWEGPNATVAVAFNSGGRVESVHFEADTRPSPLARLRAWLGW